MNLPAPSQSEYSFIIAGGGMSGISLAYYLTQSALKDESILLISQDELGYPKKTWCYWSEEAETFDKIAEKSWQHLWFHEANVTSNLLAIQPFTYSKISSDTWFAYVVAELQKHPNVHFLKANIHHFSFAGCGSNVHTSRGEFHAKKKIFDSITPILCEPANEKHIKQHFLGWVIKSHFPIFKDESAHLFDFRVAFEKECEFMYVLPTSNREALFEYTYFSGKLRTKEQYREKIKNYLLAYYNLTQDEYDLVEEEFGIIPMRPSQLPSQYVHDKILRIGTSGGFVKPSTGYSFLRTQHLLVDLVQNLVSNKLNGQVIPENRFKSWLDKVFLQVLIDQNVAGNEVFEALFRKNSPQKMLRFLAEKTTWKEDLGLMTTVPMWPFLRAAISLAWRKNELP
jgi:lycopene beta-cyclase